MSDVKNIRVKLPKLQDPYEWRTTKSPMAYFQHKPKNPKVFFHLSLLYKCIQMNYSYHPLIGKLRKREH